MPVGLDDEMLLADFVKDENDVTPVEAVEKLMQRRTSRHCSAS